MMPKKKRFYEGARFGSLTITKEIEGRNRKFVCLCECGHSCMKFGSKLHADSRCCKCRISAKRLPEYSVWRGMLTRCNPANGHKDYGGRGISVCSRWHAFWSFYDDMGPRPSGKHSIDRIDTNGNYEPINCRWATIQQQSRNKRSTIMVEYDGRTMCATDWAGQLGISKQAMHQRIKKKSPVDAVKLGGSLKNLA